MLRKDKIAMRTIPAALVLGHGSDRETIPDVNVHSHTLSSYHRKRPRHWRFLIPVQVGIRTRLRSGQKMLSRQRRNTHPGELHSRSAGVGAYEDNSHGSTRRRGACCARKQNPKWPRAARNLVTGPRPAFVWSVPYGFQGAGHSRWQA